MSDGGLAPVLVLDGTSKHAQQRLRLRRASKFLSTAAKQKAVFQRWINAHMGSESRMVVNNLTADLSDGRVLYALIEALAREPLASIGKLNHAPKLKVHCIANLNVCFKALDHWGVKLVNIGELDVYSGNSMLILGLCWSIIQFHTAKELSAADESFEGTHATAIKHHLLEWVQSCIECVPGAPACQDITSSFRDGRAFLAILNACAPDRCPYDPSTKEDPFEASEDNLRRAFSRAHAEWDVPVLLDAHDPGCMNCEKSMVAYLGLLKAKLTRRSSGVGIEAMLAHHQLPQATEPKQPEERPFRHNALLVSPSDAEHRLCVVEFKVPGHANGGSDKGPDGHRIDSIPIANGVIKAGAACDVLVYDSADHEGFASAIEEYDALIVRVVDPEPLSQLVVEGAQAKFEALMEERVAAGVCVWSSPRTQTAMGAKDALCKIATMKCGLLDTFAYDDAETLERQFKLTMAFRPRVVTQNLGSAGEGVWRCWIANETKDGALPTSDYPSYAKFGEASLGDDVVLKLMDMNDNHVEYHSVKEFLTFCVEGRDAPGAGDWTSTSPGQYLTKGGAANGGQLVDQRLLPRVAEGEVRVIMSGDACQMIIHTKPSEGLVGLSAVGGTSAYTYSQPDDPACAFAPEDGLMKALGLENEPLPLLWTCDYIAKDPELFPATANAQGGAAEYVVGEFNCSCVGVSKFQAVSGGDKTLADVPDDDFFEASKLTDLMGRQAIKMLDAAKAARDRTLPAGGECVAVTFFDQDDDEDLAESEAPDEPEATADTEEAAATETEAAMTEIDAEQLELKQRQEAWLSREVGYVSAWGGTLEALGEPSPSLGPRKLSIGIWRARDLYSSSLGYCNPYVLLKYRANETKTAHVEGSTCPVWTQEFSIDYHQSVAPLTLYVFSANTFQADTLLGKVVLPLADMMPFAEESESPAIRLLPKTWLKVVPCDTQEQDVLRHLRHSGTRTAQKYSSEFFSSTQWLYEAGPLGELEVSIDVFKFREDFIKESEFCNQALEAVTRYADHDPMPTYSCMNCTP